MTSHKKEIMVHDRLYIAAHIIDPEFPYIVFVHGGPGLNAGVTECLMQSRGIFDTLQANLVFYDQRGCGRSELVEYDVGHAHNVADLDEVVRLLSEEKKYPIAAIAGHSYGAKLVFDYLQLKPSDMLGLFIATAPSILKPRLTNLLLDLNFLKTENPKLYMDMLSDFDGDLNPDAIWALTERLADTFKVNKARPFFYWANLDVKEQVAAASEVVNLPLNSDVFRSVRRDLYCDPEHYSVDPASLAKNKTLWINGFHDLVMGGEQPVCAVGEEKSQVIFFKSAHYPHLEEPGLFCEKVNGFLSFSHFFDKS